MSRTILLSLTNCSSANYPFAKRAYLFLLGALAFSFIMVVEADGQTGTGGELDELIGRLESRYGRMRGLAADFEQTYSGPGVRVRRERGRLILQRTQRMRWEYDPKPGKLFIVNGSDVWFYVPADREAVHAQTRAVSDERFPFLFLLGQKNLRREFSTIELVGEYSQQSDLRVLRLIPRAKNSGLSEILLELSTTGRISKLSLRDDAGAVSEISLTNVRENYIAPATAFEFNPPPGVTVRQQR